MDDVALRDVQRNDLDVFFANQSDPESERMSRSPARDWDTFLAHWTTNVLGVTTGRAQTVTVGGQTAGNVVSWFGGDRRFLGYVIGREFWGRGVATAAVGLFLAQEPIRPLYADAFVGNAGSIRVLQKCGFTRIGTELEGDTEYANFVRQDP
jgi:RimJ/RimL family protein N-acetyltransferase